MFVNSEDGSMTITEGSEERDKENNRFVVDDTVDNKVFSNIKSVNDFLTSDKVNITDVVINLTEGDISIDKGVIRNNSTSTKDNIRTSK